MPAAEVQDIQVRRTDRDVGVTSIRADRHRTAFFFTEVQARVRRPLLCAAKVPPASLELRCALATVDRAVGEYVTTARLGLAA
jgi:hypothetical protein